VIERAKMVNLGCAVLVGAFASPTPCGSSRQG
jgi:hypothetical protein